MESQVAIRVNRRGRYVAVSEVTRSELVGLGVDASRIAIAYNGLPPTPEFTRQEQTDPPEPRRAQPAGPAQADRARDCA